MLASLNIPVSPPVDDIDFDIDFPDIGNTMLFQFPPPPLKKRSLHDDFLKPIKLPVKTEVKEEEFENIMSWEHAEDEVSSDDSSTGGSLNSSNDPLYDQFLKSEPFQTEDFDRNRKISDHLTDVLVPMTRTGSELDGFKDLESRFLSFQQMVQCLVPVLEEKVKQHNPTQNELNHLKEIWQQTKEIIQDRLIDGVLNQRECQYKFSFGLKCPLPKDPVYRDQTKDEKIYFFKDCAKTYQGLYEKKPYALEMPITVYHISGDICDRDVPVKVSLQHVFSGGRVEDVPEFKIENGKRKRNWAMIRGNVLKSNAKNPRIQVCNKYGDKTKTTAYQVLKNGQGTLYARVEIPAQPGRHRWVIAPQKLSDDIGKATSKDFYVKSKRTTRKKRKRENDLYSLY